MRIINTTEFREKFSYGEVKASWSNPHNITLTISSAEIEVHLMLSPKEFFNMMDMLEYVTSEITVQLPNGLTSRRNKPQENLEENTEKEDA